MKKLLVIGYIWPEPTKTAAGYRILQLVDLFMERDYQVTFCSAARIKGTSAQPLESRGVHMKRISINDDGVDQFLMEQQPQVVLYDRFVVEEQIGWRVRKILPMALQILDTEDLHFLRKAREDLYHHDIPLSEGFKNEIALREMSSMKRMDVSLIISKFERSLLINKFEFRPTDLFYLPFLIHNDDIRQREVRAVSFQERSDFCTIGNLRHAPNVDAVKTLKKNIWPVLRQELPTANIYIYGAHAPQHILSLHDPAHGFFIMGHVVDVDLALSKHKVLLAPLHYGAGLKGKIFDSLKNGLPVVATPIAAEGYAINAYDLGSSFACRAVKVHEDLQEWNKTVAQGFEILKNDFDYSAFAKALFLKIDHTISNLSQHRDAMDKMLVYHADAHFKYMSYWINAKKN